MYNIGDIFYNDEEYSARAEWCNNNGCRIEEIEADEEGKQRFQIKQVEVTEEQQLRHELLELQDWFSNVYDNQVKQYQRCTRLNTTYDTTKYGTIEELDEQAVTNAARIKEIKELLSSDTEA